MINVNVKQTGAVGDGVADDWAALQRALDEGQGGEVVIPAGTYRVPRTLKVASHTAIRADKDARIVHCGSTAKRRGDFLLSNAHPETGDSDISVTGGIWDGNFDGANNDKNPELFAEDACSGATVNFVNVRGLRLADMRVVNSVVYFVRLGGVDGFTIERICFGARRRSYNQDGLHFGGGCRNGVVRDICAVDGETNDDLLALNADDSVVRLENRDLARDVIENIEFDHIRAENCYTIIRMLSVDHAIRNITFRDIDCGCRVYAINMDGARYCRTPLFSEEDWPDGCGLIENVRIDGMRVHATGEATGQPLICAETRCRNFAVTGFERVAELDGHMADKGTLLARNLVNATVELGNGAAMTRYDMRQKSDCVCTSEKFDRLSIGEA